MHTKIDLSAYVQVCQRLLNAIASISVVIGAARFFFATTQKNMKFIPNAL
jgi:hypothetical protein